MESSGQAGISQMKARVRIESVGNGGVGVGRLEDGLTVFVPYVVSTLSSVQALRQRAPSPVERPPE